jgi:hypothetical protein
MALSRNCRRPRWPLCPGAPLADLAACPVAERRRRELAARFSIEAEELSGAPPSIVSEGVRAVTRPTGTRARIIVRLGIAALAFDLPSSLSVRRGREAQALARPVAAAATPTASLAPALTRVGT